MALDVPGDPVSGPAGSPAANEGAAAHNPVLIRTKERETGRWIGPALVGAAILIGAAAWGYIATHPAQPVGIHAVAANG
jgi:hypothetical protein